MRTNGILVLGMLAATLLWSCSHEEESDVQGYVEAIRISAGIGETTRGVIDAGYGSELEVAFVRFDDKSGEGDGWSSLAADAVRTGGSSNTTVTFVPVQNYLPENRESVLIGYYPRQALNEVTPPTVSYTITGDEDIMATELQTGAANKQFTPFTFQHLLTQLQFKCAGSEEASEKWTDISVKVTNVATSLTLSLDRTGGASLEATGTVDQELEVIGCPSAVGGEAPDTGYLMLYLTADMGTETLAISLEVTVSYDGTPKTIPVSISDIEGGVRAGHSHLITLTFLENGQITVEAGIAEWVEGNGGGSTVVLGI